MYSTHQDRSSRARPYMRASQSWLFKTPVPKPLDGKRSNEEALYILDGMTSEGSSDISFVSGEGRADSQRVARNSVCKDADKLAMKVRSLETLLGETFTTISSLKEAYLHMQSAYSPYHPDKLHLADKAIVKDLKKLSELKQNYRWKHGGNGFVSWVDKNMCRYMPTDQSYKGRGNGTLESALKSMQLELHSKDAEIDNLKETVQRLMTKKEKLERRVRKLERGTSMTKEGELVEGSVESVFPTLKLFECAVMSAKEMGKSFTKLLVAEMKAAKWDLEAAASSIEPGITYAKSSHQRFAFQSYVCMRMFSGFENENFYITGSLSSILDPAKHRNDCFRQFHDMQFMDPVELVSITPDCLFGRFCHKKFLHIVHPKMEESFFASFEHRNHIANGSHPRSRFYEVFLKFAKAVWLVHKLAFSFDPTASIFQVGKGADFCAAYMDSLVRDVEMANDTSNLLPKVGFTVTPGFRIGKSTLRCQVYLNGMKTSSE